jgi:hypothetical protein
MFLRLSQCATALSLSVVSRNASRYRLFISAVNISQKSLEIAQVVALSSGSCLDSKIFTCLSLV